MEASMVHIYVASVVHIHDLWLVAGYSHFDFFDEIKPVKGIKPVVGQIQKFHAFGSQDLPCSLGRFGQRGEFMACLYAIALLLAGRCPFRHDQNIDLIASVGVACDSAAATEHFVIRVGSYHQYPTYFDF